MIWELSFWHTKNLVYPQAVFTAATKADSLFTAWFWNILQNVWKCLNKHAFEGYGMPNWRCLDACLQGAVACVVRVHESVQGFGTPSMCTLRTVV